VLSLTKRNLREVDLILHLDSLTEVTKLLLLPKAGTSCFSWAFIKYRKSIISYNDLSKSVNLILLLELFYDNQYMNTQTMI